MNKRFNKTRMAREVGAVYYSPSDTRRLSIDMPIGNPNGGPANGDKDMPVVVVALAAGSFAAGAAAIATATTLMATVAAGALMVGSAMTIAGTVTGNKKLTKIGGIISLAGGAASLANNLAGGAAAAGAGAENVAPVLAETGAEAAAGGAISGAAAGTGTEAVSGIAGDAASGAATSGLIDAGVPAATEASSAVTAAEAANTAAQTGQAAAQATEAVTNPFMTDGPIGFGPGNNTGGAFSPQGQSGGLLGQLEQFDAATAFSPTGQQATGLQGYFDKAGQWVKDNKELTKIGLDTVSGVAKGLVPSDQEKAQTGALREQTAALKAQAERERIRQLWRQGKIA